MSYPRDCPAHGRDCQHGECPDYMAVWLRGACTSGDPLRNALVLVLDEFERRSPQSDVPLILTGVERCYVEALNAILCAPAESSDDVDRWRGQAEAYRSVATQLRRDHDLPFVQYTSDEWRTANGVYRSGS